FPPPPGGDKKGGGGGPRTAQPGDPNAICPGPAPVFRGIGVGIGFWEPMALTDVTRSPGCMVNLGFSLPAFGKTAQGTAKKDEKQENGAFYHVHGDKYPRATGRKYLQSQGWLEGGDREIAFFSKTAPPGGAAPP
ncbi:TraU family protein, partial [Escherichia coli]|nr:TraU family protein [Escherichia coli]